MSGKLWFGAVALMAAIGRRRSAGFDYSKYPDLKGSGTVRRARASGATLVRPDQALGKRTAGATDTQYQAILDASIKDQGGGGLGNSAEHSCAVVPACRS